MKPELSKKIMRALPTLTEVVMSPGAPGTGPAAPDSPDAQAVLVEQVMQRLEPMLEAQVEMQLQRAISALVHEQVQLLQPRIRQKVDAALRKAVTQAVASEFPAPEPEPPARAVRTKMKP